MEDDKFIELQRYLESQATHAWWKTQNNPYTFPTVADTLGYNLELQLQASSGELGNILDNLAQKCVDETLSHINNPPIDFSSYTRTSGNPGYKEVYIGERWVIVPEDTCVEFTATNMPMPRGGFDQGFKVTLYQEGTSDWAQFESSLTMREYEQQLTAISGDVVDVRLQPAQFQNKTGMWEDYGKPALHGSQKHIGFTDNLINGGGVMAGDSFLRQSGKVRRSYTYKVSKRLKKIGVNAKAGKVHKKAMDLAKLGRSGKLGSLTKITKPLGAIATGLQGVVIADELYHDTWDAHTVVDGALLVVGIIAAGAGAPVVLGGIAVYGILDYFFDIGKGLDTTFGRHSGFWEDTIQRAPVDREVLFQKAVEDFKKNSPWQAPEVQMDNTRVKNPFALKPPFKD